ncbi:hypothetical protein SOVF_016680 [Spinacia oleracea]|nr:hypothetical protein SOVF_016680 [Spinacia oleracea]
MLLSLIFLGTWPAVLAYLERRGRLPQHTYLDYALTNLLAAVFIALTLGEIGETKPGMPNFLTQLFQVQENWPSALFAMAGGVALSVGNLSIQYAMALAGLSVVEVVSASITVVIGTTVNYFLDDRINKAEILFPGVGCFLIAVFVGSAVHKSNDADNTAKLKNLESKLEEQERLVTPPKPTFDRKSDISASDGTSAHKVSIDLEKTNEPTKEPEFGTAKFLIQLEEKRSIKVFGRSIWIGLAITFFAGICYSFFSPLFNIATNDQFHRLRKGVPHLVVYTAFFYFSISSFAIALILNVTFLFHPILGLPKSSFDAYFKDWNGRGWALLAGLLCGFGNGLQFMGGQAAGYAAADAVQALPLVSTFWGVVAFGEYRKSTRKTYTLLEEGSPIIRVIEKITKRILSSGLEMFVVESKGGAIVCMLMSLLFLGTWPAVLAFLERRGRLPQHSYLDYSITNLLAAVIIALTLGQMGDAKPGMPNFITQLYQDNWASVLFAMAGGVVLSIGNLSTQYAWALVGLSVVEVVSASITVVIGTTLNYFLDDKINKADILFPGVACFLVAVILGSLVHSSNASDNKKKLGDLPTGSEDKADKKSATMDPENGEMTKVEGAQFGTAEFLIELENKRSIKVFDRSIWLGLAITFFSGICFSLFSPFFNLATNDQFHLLEKGVPHLVVYTAFFYFSVCCFVVAIVLNIIFLYRPILNLPKSSFKAYLADSKGRGWALLAGLLCGFGNGLQFMGGQAAGYAAADAVQALPLVSTFWAILLFGEYRKSSRRTYILLVSMLLMFIVAVGVLMASAGHRK